MNQERDFKGVWIPKNVWLDNRLNALDKIILMEIDSLDFDEKGCYASNEYLAEFCQCSLTKVSLTISKLIELDYIYLESFNGRVRTLKSRLSKNESQTSKNCEAESQKMKCYNSNINENSNIDNKESIINNTKENHKKFKKPTLEELQAYINEKGYHFNAENFINYYDSVGWKIGKSPMKDWKAACRTWESKYKNDNNGKCYNKYKKEEISRETKYPEYDNYNYL